MKIGQQIVACDLLVVRMNNKKLEDASYYGLRTIKNTGKCHNYESVLKMLERKHQNTDKEQSLNV